MLTALRDLVTSSTLTVKREFVFFPDNKVLSMASSKPLSDSSDDEDETESMLREKMRSNDSG